TGRKAVAGGPTLRIGTKASASKSAVRFWPARGLPSAPEREPSRACPPARQRWPSFHLPAVMSCSVLMSSDLTFYLIAGVAALLIGLSRGGFSLLAVPAT